MIHLVDKFHVVYNTDTEHPVYILATSVRQWHLTLGIKISLVSSLVSVSRCTYR